ncbi:hybrid sensor histidine kinase/response regulator [Paenibacillus pectinilyticus]|uniref:histidine kinase n=1 Tax=Paenibacillus pectinilyticus TaxID=512399 RepID=A0A1C1A4C2_9BACL|nr:response regulator [Paenibacillus pectinilyticus]OCT15388.1 hybrid sensor histidine kinase/response regulator [Paenibacillus pectinilyticus]
MKNFTAKLNNTVSKVNILMVDDRPENLIALEAILDSPNYRLFSAHSGEEALRHMLTTEFAVILLDVQMPGMTGFETARLIKMRERSKYVPIIFITAISQAAEHVKHGYSVGAIDYIFKPFHPETLKMKIEAFVQLHHYQEQIKLQNEVLEMVGETSNDTIVMVDEHGYMQTLNTVAAQMFGYSSDKLIGQSIDRIVPELSSFLLAEKSSGTQLIETTAVRKDAIPFPVDIQVGKASIVGQQLYVCSIRDVSDRKMMEEERFRKIFDTTPCLIALRSMKDKRYINVNDSLLKVTGFKKSEVINGNSDVLQYLVDTDDLRERESTWEKHDPWKPARNIRIRFMTHTGDLHEGLLSNEVMQIHGEDCLLSVVTDISERVFLEKEMVRLDRLNLTGEMAAGIVHEIRNPMTTVRGFLQLSKSHPSKEHTDIMIEELDRVHNIVTEFLSVAAQAPTSRKLNQINTIIETLFPLIQSKAMMGNHTIVLESGECPLIPLDEKEIRQLILNIVLNGLDAMLISGILTIKTYADDKQVVLEIKDQGEGIKEEFLEKLGTPFFSTKSKGTGLGLSICYGIAERHNAVIKVQTSLKGTTFFVHFSLGNDGKSAERFNSTP